MAKFASGFDPAAVTAYAAAMASQNPAAAPEPTVPEPVGTPLPQLKVQPIDAELEASQAAVDRRAAQHQAGDAKAPDLGESPVAGAKKDVAAAADKAADKVADKADSDKAKPAKPPRTMAQIEADMDATRERLASTINQLQTELKPGNLARRQVAKVKAFYVDEYGAVRPERVAGTVGVVVVGVVVIRVIKKVAS